MKHVVIIANDLVPGMGGPVAAPGLRAQGLADGLRAHGLQVTIIVELGLARRVWARATPSPTPHGVVRVHRRAFADYIRMTSPDAVVITNSNHFDALHDIGDVPVVYDFFAPKLLELAQDVARADLDDQLATLQERKKAALGAARAVIVNGAKKVGYVRDWMSRSSNEHAPLRVVPLGIEPLPQPTALPEGPLRAVVSGYIQPWSQPGAWTSAVRPLLDDGSLALTLMIAGHWGSGSADHQLPPEIAELLDHPQVDQIGSMEFDDFRACLSGHHVSIDVYRRNPERELAFVTRTAVSVSAGVPPIHIPFSEVSELIAEHEAGWLVDDDESQIAALLDQLVRQPELLDERRSGVRAMASALAPATATAPLVELLEDL